jgi:hypothetical protein
VNRSFLATAVSQFLTVTHASLSFGSDTPFLSKMVSQQPLNCRNIISPTGPLSVHLFRKKVRESPTQMVGVTNESRAGNPPGFSQW